MPRRSAFTLVEMLVSVALVLFIMVILTEAFGKGLDTFRNLKGLGDLETRLRSATQVLRRDLAADHFEGRTRVSQLELLIPNEAQPPREGFFRVWQSSPVGTAAEGGDGDGLASYRAVDHILHFTVRLRGNRREDFFTAPIPLPQPGRPSPLASPHTTFFGLARDGRFQESRQVFTSQWAEVAYFLRPHGQTPNSTTLHTLHRRQLLAVPNNYQANWSEGLQVDVQDPTAWADLRRAYAEISCTKSVPDFSTEGYPDTVHFNTPTDLTVPHRRFGMSRIPGGPAYPAQQTPWTYPTLGEEDPARAGADVLLGNVVSFEVKLLPLFRSGEVGFVDLYALARTSMTNRDFANVRGPRAFDTWTDVKDEIYDFTQWHPNAPGGPSSEKVPIVVTSSPNSEMRIAAVQVTLRIWDPATRLTRQLTVIQDL